MKVRGFRRRDTDEVLSAPARDDGFSLVEVVMAIALMGTVILAILNATLTSVKASTNARQSAEIQTVMQNAADRVNRADPGCDYSKFVQAAVQAKGWPATQATATYQYYSAGIDALSTHPGQWLSSQTAPVLNAPGTTKYDACGPSGARQARLIQLVTISITDLSGHTRTMQVMKSDV